MQTCLLDEFPKRFCQDSCVFNDQAVLLVVSLCISGEYCHLPQQGKFTPEEETKMMKMITSSSRRREGGGEKEDVPTNYGGTTQYIANIILHPHTTQVELIDTYHWPQLLTHNQFTTNPQNHTCDYHIDGRWPICTLTLSPSIPPPSPSLSLSLSLHLSFPLSSSFPIPKMAPIPFLTDGQAGGLATINAHANLHLLYECTCKIHSPASS